MPSLSIRNHKPTTENSGRVGRRKENGLKPAPRNAPAWVRGTRQPGKAGGVEGLGQVAGCGGSEASRPSVRAATVSPNVSLTRAAQSASCPRGYPAHARPTQLFRPPRMFSSGAGAGRARVRRCGACAAGQRRDGNMAPSPQVSPPPVVRVGSAATSPGQGKCAMSV